MDVSACDKIEIGYYGRTFHINDFVSPRCSLGLIVCNYLVPLWGGGHQLGLWDLMPSVWPLTLLMVRDQHTVVPHQ